MGRSRSSVAAWALAIALLVLPCSRSATAAEGHAPTPAPHPSSDQKSDELAKLYDAVVDTIEQRFFDKSLLRQLDWRARANSVRPSVLSAAPADDAVRRINALLSELKTSHTALLTPDEYEYYILLDIIGVRADERDLMSRRFWGSDPYYPGIGVFTRQIDRHHFVDGVLEGSPADRAGLRYGDEILTVDGMPYSPIAVFRSRIGRTVELVIRRHSNAEPQRMQAPVVPIRPTRAFSAATEASARIIEHNGSRIGYVHIWSSVESNSVKMALGKLDPGNPSRDRSRGRIVSSDVYMQANEDRDASKPLDFLIVDMRGRVGGNIAVAEQYLDLLQKPYWGNWRVSNSGFAQSGSGGRWNPPFRGRSALLIDEHTRSAAEIMAHGYRLSAFGPAIGTQTAGAVSSGALFVMPGDLLLYVAVAGHDFDGQRLEGVGVTPDHWVERPLAYAAGADPVLDVAVDLLAKQPPKR